MSRREGPIIAIGGVYIDITAKNFPPVDLTPSRLLTGGDYRISLGGSIPNFASACSQLGLETILVGKIGSDIIGRELQSTLRRNPKITPLLTSSADVTTNVGLHFIREDGQELRTGIGSANQSLQLEDVAKAAGEYIPHASYLYLGGILKLPNLLSDVERLASTTKSLGVKVILDHGRVSNGVDESHISQLKTILPYVDYYLPSKEEFLQVWNAPTIEEAAQKARSVSSATIVIKNGENGAIGVMPNGELKLFPAFPVNVIDTVGAGDTFNAGFIKAQSLGLSYDESIIFANAVAAIKVSQTQPPTVEQVLSFMQDNIALPDHNWRISS